MQPKVRSALANTTIAVVAIGGGLALTDHYTQSSGGIAALFGQTASTGTGATGSTDQTVTGAPIQYQYGTIQLEVVQKSGKISEVNLVQATANAGREQAFPYLVQYALDAQGTSFGNLSGATFTTDAFKQALDSALSKLK